jgi:ankyrin repeat protein
MSFQCTACWEKTYDKAWKLARHVRESKNCFDQINLGMPANHFVRFRCSSCGYAPPRELDLDRHRRRVHGETDDPITPGPFSTSSADASTKDSAMISDLLEPGISHDHTFPTKALQSNAENRSFSLDGTYPRNLSIDPATDLFLASIRNLQSPSVVKADEHLSGKTEQCVSNLSPWSQAYAKRKHPYHDRLLVDHKRFCAGIDPASNLGVKDVSTNEGDIPEHGLDLGLVSETLHDFLGLDFHPDKIGDEDFLTALGSGELFEAASAFVDAFANIYLAPTAEDHVTPTERHARDWVQDVILRNEPQTLPSEKTDPFPSWNPGLWTESVPTPSIHTNPSIHSSPILPSNQKCRSSVTSSSGISHSVNSKGSLFGIPSTHSYKPWMTWSSGSRTQASAAKSLHSNGMPAPMLNSVDEELLLSRGAWTSEERPDNISSSHLTPQEQFGLAAADDDVERLRLLVEDLAFDCNSRDHEGRTALIWAAERGHHQAVEILLSNSCGGVDANAQDDRGMTAMMFACYRGDLRIFDSLLSVPAIDLGITNKAGPTALIIAIQSRDPDSAVIVQRLISYVQTRPDYHTTATKWHPIFNAQDGRGLTPLHWAVKLGQHDCISTLLDTKRVNVDIKALDGTTPAMHAIEEIVQPDILELLFDRKACDPTVTNELGETLVEVALRVVQESDSKLADSGRCDIPADRCRLQTARENLYLCEAYVHHCAGKQDQAIESTVRAGSVL